MFCVIKLIIQVKLILNEMNSPFLNKKCTILNGGLNGKKIMTSLGKNKDFRKVLKTGGGR